MRLSNLKEVYGTEIRKYLIDRYNLTSYQASKLYDDDFPRDSPYVIYGYEEEKNGGLFWRLTLPFIIPYYILMLIFVLIKWLVTGNRYFEEKQLRFHRFWMRKLGINWL